MSTSRRQFLERLVHVALVPAAAGVTGAGALGALGSLAGCGGDDTTPAIDGGPVACTSIAPSIGGNHGHAVSVPLADVAARSAKTYTLTNNGSHAHSVSVTRAHFETLASGSNVIIESSENGSHTHTVTLTCAALGLDAGNDAGSPSDAGQDASSADAGQDANSSDAGTTDAGTTDAGTTDGGTLACNTPTISSNHGHAVTIPLADVLAGVQKTYTLATALSHMHDVTFTSADFAMLSQGATVVKTSGVGNSHTHDVSVTCALS